MTSKFWAFILSLNVAMWALGSIVDDYQPVGNLEYPLWFAILLTVCKAITALWIIRVIYRDTE